MTTAEAQRILLREIKIYFKADPGQASKVKLQKLAKQFSIRKEKEINDYVQMTKQSLRFVKDKRKRSSVDYFIAILVSDNNVARFKDYVAAHRDIINDTATDSDDSFIKGKCIQYSNTTYWSIGEINDIKVFFDPFSYTFVVVDLAKLVPEITKLLTWNIKNPDKKITLSSFNSTMLRRMQEIINQSK